MPDTPRKPDGPPADSAAVLPFEAAELQALLRRPAALFDLVLAERGRFAANVTSSRCLPALVAALALVGAVATLPYALVLDPARCWRVAAFYLGSVLISWPALQVFGTYFGCRWRLEQSLAIVLVVSMVGGMFSLGFFPILWFLQVTMQKGDWIAAGDLSIWMLAVGMVAGLGCLARLLQPRLLPWAPSFGSPLLVLWQLLLFGISLRMARALDLLAA